MAKKEFSVSVTGMKEVRRAVRLVENAADRKGMQKELKSAYRTGARLVELAAQQNAPVGRGRLRKSIKAGATLTGAYVQAGGARVPYAGAQEYGRKYPNGRKSQGKFYLWRAAKSEAEGVRGLVEQELGRWLDRAFPGG